MIDDHIDRNIAGVIQTKSHRKMNFDGSGKFFRLDL